MAQPFGERFGDGPGAIHRSDWRAAKFGGHGARLKQHQVTVPVLQEFDVLGSAEQCRQTIHQRRQLTAAAAVEIGLPVVVAVAAQQTAPTVEKMADARYPAADHGVRSAGGHHRELPIDSPGHRLDAEAHSAESRIDHRLDEDGDRWNFVELLLRRNPLGRTDHRYYGVGDLVILVDPGDRVESAGHRVLRRVLHDR